MAALENVRVGMGEKGNDVAEVARGGQSLVGQAGSATANVVLDTGETLRGKLVEGAAEGMVQSGRERLRRREADPEDPEDGEPTA